MVVSVLTRRCSGRLRRSLNLCVSRMDIFDLLTQPTALIGCLLGFACAALLHFVFPEENLLFLQALLVAFGTLIGMFVAYSSPKHNRDRE